MFFLAFLHELDFELHQLHAAHRDCTGFDTTMPLTIRYSIVYSLKLYNILLFLTVTKIILGSPMGDGDGVTSPPPLF